MRKILALVVIVTIVLIAIDSAKCQKCKGCYRLTPSEPWICIIQNYGWYVCFGGASCTHADECGIAGGGGSCFLAGALVEVKDGQVPIQMIREGDVVLNVEDDGGALQMAVVTRTYKAIEPGYFVINGALRVTGSHPFKVGDKWVKAKDLRVDDEVVGRDGQSIKIGSIAKVERYVRVYNIEVAGSHTFFVDGMLVHNKIDPPQN
jgi:hypothetical protein